MRTAALVIVVTALGSARVAHAQKWQDATAQCIGTTGEWSNKIELADIDGDGLLDILIANGRGYDQPPTPAALEPSRVWQNLGNWSGAGPHCSEITGAALGGFTGYSRTIKVADVDGDGDVDIFTGGSWHTQAKLFTKNGTGAAPVAGWTDASAQLPQQLTSIGDAEFGDIDGDGDLDLVITDWGTTDPHSGAFVGGPMRVYLNDGHGTFTEDTTRLPTQLAGWTWDMELVDVDNDWDLDVLVACKLCTSSYLFRNDGTGHFTADTTALPHFTNNYEFEPMDIDGDGDLDLVTINDGPNVTEHIFVNDGAGVFSDGTSTRLTGTANPANIDDNAAVWVDADNDGDADLLIASLGGPDRLALNDGFGHFTLAPNATPDDTPGSLGIAVGDLDGDGRPDVVQAQGEVDFPDKVQLASSAIAVDTQPPSVRFMQLDATTVVARIHDHRSPSHAGDWKSVVVKLGDGSTVPMTWYGEYLWRAKLPSGAVATDVCATDAANNTGCGQGPVLSDDVIRPDADTITPPDPGHGGGCCDSGGNGGVLASIAPIAFVVLALSARSRRRDRGCGSRSPDRR